jgi:tetratricopeptide (TPR) repeat protein
VYEELLKLKQDYANAHHHLGLAYKKSGQPEKAIQSFQEELRAHPENSYAHLYLGEVYLEAKNYPKALAHFEKALKDSNLPDAERIRKVLSSLEMNLTR